MEKPKLSICMIVKNEEANLQRCLDSFLPIIQMKDDKTLKLLTELIIVDTGSTDRTINIAKKFTGAVRKRIFFRGHWHPIRGSDYCKREIKLWISRNYELQLFCDDSDFVVL